MKNELEAFVQSNGLTGEMFFIINDNDNYIYRRVILHDENTEPLITENFKKSITDEIIKRISVNDNDDAIIDNITDMNYENKGVYCFDIASEDKSTIIKIIEEISSLTVADNPIDFKFNDVNLDNIIGLVYHISDGDKNIFLYQHRYPNFLHKKSRLSFLGEGDVLVPIPYDMINISKVIDFFVFEGISYAINIKLLEERYGLTQVIDNMVSEVTPKIIEMEIVNKSVLAEPEKIFDDMKDDRGFMRKLARVLKNGILELNIDVNIVNEIKTSFPTIGRNIDLINDGNGIPYIKLTSKARKKAFIRLLNDEAVRSVLTQKPSIAQNHKPEKNIIPA
ncbi:Kiwa anti-phage protein KwaB-like domain-containing protein [Serratia odorifera]|uniref:Kiwa anti-phage protein KwaB-like domain-containing protein n=1 Tax=Serratia odorifera TaxID=618 RepID=UPI0035325C5B